MCNGKAENADIHRSRRFSFIPGSKADTDTELELVCRNRDQPWMFALGIISPVS